MRLPTFSRHSDATTETEDRAPVSARTDAPTQSGAVQAGRPEDLAAADRAATERAADRAATERVAADRAAERATTDRAAADRAAERATTGRAGADHAADRAATDRTAAAAGTYRHDARTDERRAERAAADDRDSTVPMAVVDRDKTRHADRDRIEDARTDRTPEPLAGPKPRASLLATLALITGVAGALLVLSGPLLGYGIGVAGLALILSIAGIRATGKRHVAGKTDALIGLVLALAAIVVGVLALTGSLSWLGTDMHPVTSLREWLDTQFANRF
ncbi:UbiA family prenyltransferase [Actinoplanes sp. NPDC049681]|uniref:UbiA family prenyltransferase n=1 Tax=Actinoplanes sp. NPDC049681 TaxID=3363905 RepID=UPI0037960D9D